MWTLFVLYFPFVVFLILIYVHMLVCEPYCFSFCLLFLVPVSGASIFGSEDIHTNILIHQCSIIQQVFCSIDTMGCLLLMENENLRFLHFFMQPSFKA